MDMTGEQTIAAPRERVWAALNDPEILRQAIPGCESVERVSDNEFTAAVVAKVGPVKAKFRGKVTLSDIDPPNGYRIEGEGQGGAAGFGKGGAKVTLADVPEGTRLSYVAHATVGGKLAQIGSRLVDSTARKMADDFFKRFKDIVGEPVAAPGGAAAEVVTGPEATGAEEAADIEPVAREAIHAGAPHPIAPTTPPAVSPVRTLPPWIWVGGLILLAIVVLVLYAQ